MTNATAKINHLGGGSFLMNLKECAIEQVRNNTGKNLTARERPQDRKELKDICR
jgi:molecular chaperone DnaK (HSP70)